MKKKFFLFIFRLQHVVASEISIINGKRLATTTTTKMAKKRRRSKNDPILCFTLSMVDSKAKKKEFSLTSLTLWILYTKGNGCKSGKPLIPIMDFENPKCCYKHYS
jgi:hypothetical protein